MQVTKKQLSDTQVQLLIEADTTELQALKEQTLKNLRHAVKVSGFREGKAPLHLIEKQLNPSQLQAEFLDAAINRLYIDAASEQKLRPVAQPQISITKFVPFDTLEFTAEVEVVGELTLPDYKKLQAEKRDVKVTAKEVNETLERLLIRESTKQAVKRAAQDSDEVLIDFSGVDAKTKEPISGADGKDYPLVLGSGSFIPGFEPELVGLKAGQDKTFTVTFPKEYGVKALQGRKVIFTVTVKKVQALKKPALDNRFAVKVGPFKTIEELKADVKKQLTAEKQRQADREYENALVEKIAAATDVALPKILVDDQIEQMEREERQNLAYRGQTWEEHLHAEGVNEAEHRERNRADAELRVKIGLSLAEIAALEGITVTRDELANQVQLLKQQYPDPQMQAEIDKPENRQDIYNRLVTEKTLERLLSYGPAKQ